MKKLLVLLLISALAVFVFVGCDLLPSEGEEGEGEGEGEVEICPTVEITSQVEVEGKTFIKGGEQTITVTFAVPTAPVSVYVGEAIKAAPTGAAEVVMYANADKTVYTGTYDFGSISKATCGEAYVYVETCETCTPCKYPYTVDTVKPEIGEVEICIDECICEGCELTFKSGKITACEECDPDVYCKDCCSGFAGWTVQIYNKDPFKGGTCCDMPCAEPIDEGEGDCQVDFTTTCLEKSPVWALVTALDNVGNKTKMLTKIEFTDTCDTIILDEVPAGECVDTPEFVVCKEAQQAA